MSPDGDRHAAGSSPSATIDPDQDALVCDVMLGTLTVYLRACGYDATYAGDRCVEDDDRLLELAAAEGRVLLTRDVTLADRASDVILLTELEVADQLAELRDGGAALELADPPARCGRCNGRLEPIDANPADLPEYVPTESALECVRCPDCGQIFWTGSHTERMRETLEFE